MGLERSGAVNPEKGHGEAGKKVLEALLGAASWAGKAEMRLGCGLGHRVSRHMPVSYTS